MRPPKIVQDVLENGQIEYLERYVNHESALLFDNTKCIDCGFCQIVCLKEAIKENTNNAPQERALKYTVDQQKCIYCGICEIFCPVDALTLKLKGEHRLIIQETKMMPQIESTPILVEGKVIKKVLEGSISIAPLEKVTKKNSELLVNSCPTRAIKIEMQKVNTSSEKCLFCTRCTRVVKQHKLHFTITVYRSYIHRTGHDISTLWNDVATRLLSPTGKIEGMKGDVSYKIADRITQLMKSLKKDLLPNDGEK
jgi:formate hydrogenlyase subunit 6/NADH:ubiquinone oxidoreductase subunit I